MDPIICASALLIKNFPWPPDSAVMQAAIQASLEGADRNAKMENSSIPFWLEPTRDLSVS